MAKATKPFQRDWAPRRFDELSGVSTLLDMPLDDSPSPHPPSHSSLASITQTPPTPPDAARAGMAGDSGVARKPKSSLFITKNSQKKHDLSRCSRSELEEMLEQNQKLLRDESFIGKLPDRGQRLTKKRKELEERLAQLPLPEQQAPAEIVSAAREGESISELMSGLHLTGSTAASGPLSPGRKVASPAQQSIKKKLDRGSKIKTISLVDSIQLQQERQREIEDIRLREAEARLKLQFSVDAKPDMTALREWGSTYRTSKDMEIDSDNDSDDQSFSSDHDQDDSFDDDD
ncbi:uncharacterized protein BJ171DRAFT_583004 [Polychytrium aggregatum]|uniref:uncharacterized protein n=1 Tax=Polychytrium aggregatum TaxID=110093 RepID=UPI0022FEBF32|nr:uncharacterized protein BJ171DRAFT_583004 [Polychytrium aggregatum]KAI9203506.1 hypothetical protein BJ171DRAFT_583004 [Polychytrium aggregatum]